jgi:hypothetical protein
MPDKPMATPIELMRMAFTSEFVPPLFCGAETHEPSLRVVAQLVKHTNDDGLIEAVVTAALPKHYSGDTIVELPGMIAGAKKRLWRRGTAIRRIRDERIGPCPLQVDRQERHRRQRERPIRSVGLGSRHNKFGLGPSVAVARRR